MKIFLWILGVAVIDAVFWGATLYTTRAGLRKQGRRERATLEFFATRLRVALGSPNQELILKSLARDLQDAIEKENPWLD